MQLPYTMLQEIDIFILGQVVGGVVVIVAAVVLVIIIKEKVKKW